MYLATRHARSLEVLVRKATHCERFAWLKAYKLLAVFLFFFACRCFWKFNFYCRWYFFLWCRVRSFVSFVRVRARVSGTAIYGVNLFAIRVHLAKCIAFTGSRCVQCSMEVWKYSMSFLIARIRCKCALIKNGAIVRGRQRRWHGTHPKNQIR